MPPSLKLKSEIPATDFRKRGGAMHRLSLLIGVLVAATACGSSPTTPSSTFHAEVTEAAGDAVVSADVPTSPDLIHGTLDVGGGNLTVTVQFAPGTLSPSTVVTILLDTDQNPATGFNDTGYGIDYGVSLNASTAAFIQRAIPSSCASGGNCYTYVGTASISLGTDTMATTIPLSILGNADGRLGYRVFAGVPATPTIWTDVMPDMSLPPAHVP
jgi:hypothetical protein